MKPNHCGICVEIRSKYVALFVKVNPCGQAENQKNIKINLSRCWTFDTWIKKKKKDVLIVVYGRDISPDIAGRTQQWRAALHVSIIAAGFS